MLMINFAYDEARTVINSLKDQERQEYNSPRRWKTTKVLGKIEKTIDKQYGDAAKFHEAGEAGEKQTKPKNERIGNLVNVHNRNSMVR